MRSLDDWVLLEVKNGLGIKTSDKVISNKENYKVVATVETDIAEAVKRNLRQMVWENSFSFNA